MCRVRRRRRLLLEISALARPSFYAPGPSSRSRPRAAKPVIFQPDDGSPFELYPYISRRKSEVRKLLINSPAPPFARNRNGPSRLEETRAVHFSIGEDFYWGGIVAVEKSHLIIRIRITLQLRYNCIFENYSLFVLRQILPCNDIYLNKWLDFLNFFIASNFYFKKHFFFTTKVSFFIIREEITVSWDCISDIQ